MKCSFFLWHEFDNISEYIQSYNSFSSMTRKILKCDKESYYENLSKISEFRSFFRILSSQKKKLNKFT